jgi:hypothetical protein
LRFRLAKAPLPERGWIGHMPLLANRHYLGGFFVEEDVTTPWRNEPIRAGLLCTGSIGLPRHARIFRIGVCSERRPVPPMAASDPKRK